MIMIVKNTRLSLFINLYYPSPQAYSANSYFYMNQYSNHFIFSFVSQTLPHKILPYSTHNFTHWRQSTLPNITACQ